MFPFYNKAKPEHERIQNIILHYRLDNSSGDVFDSSPNRDHGVAGGGVTRGVSGKLRDCFTFDGVDDQITNSPTNAINAIKNTAVFTVAFWARTDAYRTNDCAVAIRNGTGTSTFRVYPYWDNTIGLRFYWNGTFLNTGSVYSLDTWNHFCMRSVSQTVHEVYVNGVYLGYFSNNDKLSNGTDNIDVGCGYPTFEHFDGDLDDIRIYDRAISAAEIAVLAKYSTGFES